MGLASSDEAALLTCSMAALNTVASRVTTSPAGSGISGKSSVVITRIENSEGLATMRASWSSIITSTAPGRSERTTSAISFERMRVTPSPEPLTVTVTEIVRSPSLPVAVSWSPASSRRTPPMTAVPPRVATPRPATPSASASTSLSHLNCMLIVRLLLLSFV